MFRTRRQAICKNIGVGPPPSLLPAAKKPAWSTRCSLLVEGPRGYHGKGSCADHPDMSGSGLPALIYSGAWLGNEFDMEAIACGRGALRDADCVLEICGQFL